MTLKNAPFRFRSVKLFLFRCSVSPEECLWAYSPAVVVRVSYTGSRTPCWDRQSRWLLSTTFARSWGWLGCPVATVPQQLSFFKSLCWETQLKSSWGPKLAVHRGSSLSALPPSGKDIFSLKQRSLDFSSSQSHFSTCALILFFRLLGREVGCKISRIAPGARFRKDAAFAIFCSPGNRR